MPRKTMLLLMALMAGDLAAQQSLHLSVGRPYPEG